MTRTLEGGPRRSRPRRLPVLCGGCGKEAAWHIMGADRYEGGAARYCGTLLPRGIDLVDRGEQPPPEILEERDGLAAIAFHLFVTPTTRFGRLDGNRTNRKGVRHVRSAGQSQPSKYPEDIILDALGSCEIWTSFRGVIAFAPFLLECFHCGVGFSVEPPTGVIAHRDPLDVRLLKS